MNAQPDIIAVPLNKLQLSPKNSRKRRSQEHIAATWESLRVHGQLQNLVVSQDPASDGYLVDAGGTRFLAFRLGAEKGEIPADYPVRCLQVAEHSALEVSTAENTIREAMHPADQFRAFKKLVDESKKTPSEIAAHFSVAESVVVQRLKLANVDPELFALYDEGKMKLEQLQALALTDDRDAQRRAWFGVKGAKVEHDWQRRPEEIRKRITAKEVGPDNPLVKFVEPQLYEAAGGTVRRDMFSEDVYFNDVKLLEKLAANKLDALALAEKNAGWSWVEAYPSMDYSTRSRYAESHFVPAQRPLTAEEKVRRAAIEQRLKEIDDQLEATEYGPEQDILEEEQIRLHDERDAMDAARESWSDEAKSKTGVLIYIDRHDGVQILRARLKPGQKLSAGKVQGGKSDSPKKPALSQDMVQRLEMHRAAALREHIAARPAAALQLLLTHLMSKLLSDSRQPSYGETVLELGPANKHRDARTAIDSKFADLGKAPARKAIDDRIAEWKKAGMPAKASDLHTWIGKLPEAKRLELLALATALTLNTNAGHRGAALAEQFDVDMAKWWAPTADNYIGVVAKPLLAEAVADVAGKAEGEAVLALKKDAAMAEAAKKLAGTGWLPKPLRGDAYQLHKKAGMAAKPAPAKPKAQAKPTTKRPAKKAAKKAAPKRKK